jgi:dGTPase
MEACDDIAYSALDAEDAIKKGLASFSDLIAFLQHRGMGDTVTTAVCNKAVAQNTEFREQTLSPAELNDISMQMFRVYAVGAMIREVTEAFSKELPIMLEGKQTKDLIECSGAKVLCGALKEFDKRYAYVHRSVLEIELTGYRVIQQLMDYFWEAITARENILVVGSKRRDPFANYTYNRISENYRRIAETPDNKMPVRYREMQLMTDMVSGMTDTYAIDLCKELEGCRGDRQNH